MGASPHDVLLREPRRSPISVWLLPALLAGGGHSVQPRRGSSQQGRPALSRGSDGRVSRHQRAPEDS
ncbi:g9607 [Coccomyxa viridis]|uniref:G9607 protein n=1 Tax=Coccomyxa viridis TaxID=1274662 RepID=A0ABP1G395_9CHLO